MKNIVLKFGLLSGFLVAGMAAVMTPLCANGTVSFDDAEIVGYSSMVLSFLLIFFGIRSFRNNVQGGVISFGRAFKVGLLITLISSAIYVISWEIVYYNFLPDFADKYAAHVIDKMEKSGEPAAAVEAKRVQMAQFKEWYKNPFLNVGMTLMEIFPVGLIMTLISAAILRRKTPVDDGSERIAVTA